jgi:hypothetical protein
VSNNQHKVTLEEAAYVQAHKYSALHREQILASDLCGCFYCLKIFSPSDIDEWVDEDVNEVEQTALCPKCGIDSVIGSATGFPLTMNFLRKMKHYWF